jgi:hypothetical protein
MPRTGRSYLVYLGCAQLLAVERPRRYTINGPSRSIGLRLPKCSIRRFPSAPRK